MMYFIKKRNDENTYYKGGINHCKWGQLNTAKIYRTYNQVISAIQDQMHRAPAGRLFSDDSPLSDQCDIFEVSEDLSKVNKIKCVHEVANELKYPNYKKRKEILSEL